MRACWLIWVLLAAGCSSVTGTRKPDGTLTVTSFRALWKSEAIAFSLKDTNGFTATLTIARSGTDEQSVKAAVEGAVSAIIRAYRPLP